MESGLESGLRLADAATAASAILWSGAYLQIVRVGARDGVPGMPLFAMLLNLSWEFVFSFIYPSPSPQIYANYAWLVIDLAIAYQWFAFGRFEGRGARLPFVPLMLVLLAGCVGLMMACVLVLGDLQGRNTAYTQNLLMSVLFIDMLRRRASTAGQSAGAALLKMLGTMSAGVGTVLRGLDTPYLRGVIVAIFILDLAYFAMLVRVPVSIRDRSVAST